LLTKCGITKPPVDLRAVIEQAGIQYREVDYLPYRKDALIYSLSGSKVIALVNEYVSEPTRRFTLAHALCHHILHGEPDVLEGHVLPGKPPSIRINRDDFRAYEREADLFAFELLLPTYLLRKQPRNLTYAELARRFKVSKSVVIAALHTA
jgi:Zn-dependent peptidase ImmA (M78 family)